MKIAHTADIHYSVKNAVKALKSLKEIREFLEANPDIKALIIAGDLFDEEIANSFRGGLPDLQLAIFRILQLVPIIAVEGTPTHDIPGSYEALSEMRVGENKFHLLKFGKSVTIEDTLFLGLPEPSKAWLLKDSESGKDESAQIITEQMREILLGIAATIKEHKGKSVFVYHGEVSGAVMQNGYKSEHTDVTIGPSDLDMLNADYIALGHIHIGQHVAKNAYYSGSAFPVNWGELDKKRFLVSDLDAWPTIHFFSHPTKHKVSMEITEESTTNGFAQEIHEHICEIPSMSEIWLDITSDEKMAKRMDRQYLLKMLLEEGAAPGSRVTIKLKTTEMTRAAEIVESKVLRDKVRVYADNNGDLVQEDILELANQLEEIATKTGKVSAGYEWEINKIRLRGAIGILRGQLKDEIVIDFSQYDSDLIALVADNGRGKTTLMENMHTFPCFLTRSGTLQSQFCLKDSARDIHMTNKLTGDKYRFLMNIDGATESGGVEYFIYKNDAPITNGRKADYESKIKEMFGSLNLFVKSVFVPQKPPKGYPELCDATKGEKKAIFAELAGLDYLQAYSDTAKEKAAELESEIISKKAELRVYEQLESTLPGLKEKVRELKTQLDEAVFAREKMREQLPTLVKNTTDALQFKIENEKNAATLQSVQSQIKTVEASMTQKANECEELESVLVMAPEIGQQIEDFEVLEKAMNKTLESINDEQKKLSVKQLAYSEYEKKYIEARADKQNIISAMNNAIKVKEAKKEALLEKINQTVTCPECGTVFTPENDLKTLQEAVYEIDKEIAGFKKDIIAETEAQQKIVMTIEKPDEIKYWDLKKAFGELKKQWSLIDIKALREKLQASISAKEVLAEHGKSLSDLSNQLKILTEESTQLLSLVDENADSKYSKAVYAEEARRKSIEDMSGNISLMNGALASSLERVEEAEKQINSIATLKEEVASSEKLISNWKYLSKACGKDGIQALELDALSPEIAMEANELLCASYGDRYTIKFKTTKDSGSGSRAKQIEDFLIFVYDSTDGWEQEISTLSGGEYVWIRKAIYDAFGVIRARNINLKFLTCFQDEADGALDADNKRKYIRMIEETHRKEGRTHTILITHSEEAKALIGQKIDLNK